MKFFVSQRVTQTLVYFVEDATSKEDAVAQVKGGQIPVAYEQDGDILWATAEAAP
jgi:hypothetical protein